MSSDNVLSSLLDDPNEVLLGSKEGVTLFNHGTLDVLMQLPLPGVVIFVHGVNSDAEWYEQGEEGLCKGLNARLRRCDDHLSYTGPEAGQLSPTSYMPELTRNGYINPDRDAKTFIQSDDSFSPVIRFRWGYKASGEELQKFGDGIYLNEQEYWGGGPFANGCTTLPDLWGQGLSEELFLWLHVQHMNPTNDRQVYTCPPRAYTVLAAYRLAKLVESLRRKQADVPITIVCHSQGNMVGITAAFLGDALPDATDAAGRSGRCVADTYVLCNPPYSLVKSNGTESWSERGMTDAQGHTGRQTESSRQKTLAAFFDIIRARQACQHLPARIDRRMSNPKHDFTAEADQQRHGLRGSDGQHYTFGRVTLYCNPHDQVISATTVQGIGWRGMSAQDILHTEGPGVFTQRVFAQGFKVGESGITYDYWANQYNQPKRGSPDFWQPNSPPAEYSVAKGLDAEKSAVGKILTVLTAPFFILALKVVKIRVNALPPDEWQIPLLAPPLPEPFMPEALRFGAASKDFDQGFDAPGDYRDKDRQREAGDPYAGVHEKDGRTDAPQGNQSSEASLRYEHHAVLRMQARREGLYRNDQKVEAEDEPTKADDKYTQWRTTKIKTMLAENLDEHATDHSTIMTNPMHAEMALAYDLAVGCCDIRAEDLHQMRIAADWRLVDGLKDPDDPHQVFFEYFDIGKFKGKSAHDWANASDSEAKMPAKIADEREWAPPPKREDVFR